MSLFRFHGRNHPQQVAVRGVLHKVDDRETDPADFATFSERFGGFTLDVAAAAHNTKCDRYFDRASDGLRQSWAGERVWCNPPFSAIEPWVMKAWEEYKGCPIIVMIVPANRTEQGWWHRHVEPRRDQGNGFRTQFLAGRLRFIRAGSESVGPNERPPFGVCFLIWSVEA